MSGKFLLWFAWFPIPWVCRYFLTGPSPKSPVRALECSQLSCSNFVVCDRVGTLIKRLNVSQIVRILINCAFSIEIFRNLDFDKAIRSVKRRFQTKVGLQCSSSVFYILNCVLGPHRNTFSFFV